MLPHSVIALGKKKKAVAGEKQEEKTKKSKSVLSKLKLRQKTRSLEKALEDQFTTGRIYACISSRPGQSGRADGYILEGKELEFYAKKLKKTR